jgi:FlaG/FlaF family flagellin (archaellin)
MVSGIRFFACSGAMGNTISSLYANGHAEIGLEIFNFEIGATDSPNRLGFFGLNGAPTSAVIVGQYQDRTHRCDHLGSDLGTMINVKFTGTSSATVSGVDLTETGHTLATIPQASGTLLCRFTEANGTSVITQNATFRAVNFDSGSGVPNINDLATGITVQCAQLADNDGNAGDASWSEISSGGSTLSLADQSTETHVHDFHLILSGSPTAAGRKINFGYYIQLEFL